jgi:hypothetical protein
LKLEDPEIPITMAEKKQERCQVVIDVRAAEPTDAKERRLGSSTVAGISTAAV